MRIGIAGNSSRGYVGTPASTARGWSAFGTRSGPTCTAHGQHRAGCRALEAKFERASHAAGCERARAHSSITVIEAAVCVQRNDADQRRSGFNASACA